MTIWRPVQHIRVKALGLAWKHGRLLASEVYTDDGRVKGVRPLGGSVEFGETWQTALIREFQEELGVRIEISSPPLVMENIYIHHGMTGHEVIFAVDVRLPDTFPDADCIEYREDDGTPCIARWFDLSELDKGDLALYPSGLKTRLAKRAASRDHDPGSK
jgi:ADP-ribose pyrophosphatase YjhB (NUDIX family)